MFKLKRLWYNYNMEKRACLRGFTLIELALSLIFISILSITVVLLIQNTAASYRRGVILGEVNTVGMDLIDDFRISLQNASSESMDKICEEKYDRIDDEKSREDCKKDHGYSFILVTKRAEVEVEGKPYGTMPVFGAFCTGMYTYIWNSGYFEDAGNDDFDSSRKIDERKVLGDVKKATLSKFGNNSTDSRELVAKDFRLLKVYDGERTVCVNAMADQDTDVSTGKKFPNYKLHKDYENSKIKSEFYISNSMYERANSLDDGYIELLKSSNVNDLVLYDLFISKPAISVSRGNAFYAASFILGTRRGGIDIKDSRNCRPPSNEFTEFEYCAINKFNFAVQAGGKW